MTLNSDKKRKLLLIMHATRKFASANVLQPRSHHPTGPSFPVGQYYGRKFRKKITRLAKHALLESCFPYENLYTVRQTSRHNSA